MESREVTATDVASVANNEATQVPCPLTGRAPCDCVDCKADGPMPLIDTES